MRLDALKIKKLKTRKPTCVAPWPMTLTAGVQGAGKSWAAAAASASPLIDRTLWVPCGEDAPDDLGNLTGQRIEIAEHDGTWDDLLSTVAACVNEPTTQKPNMIVIDGMTAVWELLCDMAEAETRKRGKGVVTMNLWNDANQRHRKLLNVLRNHNGPVVLTARMSLVTVIDDNGKPTTDKTWKIASQKNLPFEVDALVEMRSREEHWITKVRSVKFGESGDKPKIAPNGFSHGGLWAGMGIGGAPTQRNHAPIEQVALDGDHNAQA